MTNAVRKRGVVQGDKPTANFTIHNATPLYRPDDFDQLAAVELQIHAPDGTHELLVDLRKSLAQQILDAVPACRLLNPSAASSIDTEIIEAAAKNKFTTKAVLLSNFGLHQLRDGRWLFAAGEEILGDHSGITVRIHPTVAEAKLAGGTDFDSHEAVRHILRAAERYPGTIWPTFCYTMLSSLRSQIISLGLSTFPCLYLAGIQGLGKTSLAVKYCLLYDVPDDNGVPLPCGLLEADSTDKALIRAIAHHRDQTVLVDDLPNGSDPSIRRQRQKLIAEILRFAANGHSRQTAAFGDSGTVSHRCRAGVVFTGEIPLTAASDITRMIEIHLTHPMTEGQPSDRHYSAAAFRAWMTWLLPHLDNELERLEASLTQLTGGENARLQTTAALLNWVSALFYQFALECGVTTQTYYTSSCDVAAQVFGEILSAQAQKVRRIQDEPPMGNLSFYILRAYREGKFHVISHRKRIRDRIDCLVENDALCIQSETLVACLQGHACFKTLSTKQLGKALREEGVLSSGKEGRSASKRIHKQRYLELRFDALESAAKRY